MLGGWADRAQHVAVSALPGGHCGARSAVGGAGSGPAVRGAVAVKVGRGVVRAGNGRAGVAAGELLVVAAWVSVAVVVVVLLYVQPLLVTAVVAPAVVLVRRRAEVAWWRRVAMTDPLTGLWNRYGWQERCGALRRADAHRGDVGPAVVLVDVDRFKMVNDTYGHPTGDAVLRAVGAALSGAVRAGDVVARLGGDEFGVVLRGVGPAGLARVTDRIRDAISSTPVTAADGWTVTEVTVSIGAAVGLLEPAGVPELLSAADRALYVAKGSGRDAVRLAVLVASTPPDDDGADPGQDEVSAPSDAAEGLVSLWELPSQGLTVANGCGSRRSVRPGRRRSRAGWRGRRWRWCRRGCWRLCVGRRRPIRTHRWS